MTSSNVTMDRTQYYAQAQSWALDTHRAMQASRRRAWWVAGAAILLALLEAVALVLLLPLKTVVPYTITVDRQTGYMEMAAGLKPGSLSAEAAVVQAFLFQYVVARETFDVTDLEDNYQKVAAWTGGPARDEYIAAMQRSNPAAAQNAGQAGTIVKTVVKSISMLSPSSALVRFETERHAGAAPVQRQPYAAIIAFRKTGAPPRMEARLLNPLALQVVSYRRDAETAVPVSGP
jgi:type IV secretion system protein VirB8